MDVKDAIKLWKKLRIKTCTMDFNCGGDSMGDTSFSFTDKNGDVSCDELKDFFDNTVYQKVNFYEISDGYYQGESGTVEITLNDEGDDFEYCKNAQSEYSETHTSETEIELSPEMVAFIQENVSNINGAEGEETTINFKREFIMTDEQEKIQEKLQEKIYDEISAYEPDDLSEDTDEWFTFTTNEEGEELTIEGNRLKITVRNSYTEYRDSD